MLSKASDIKILIPSVKEADPTGMVPTSSTSITLLLGDCLATTVMYKRKFSKEKFKVVLAVYCLVFTYHITCTAKYANHVYMGILCDHYSTLDSLISAFNPP